MIVKIVLVGRPNVGKSTLFNVLTNSRNALVSNVSGLTIDVNIGHLDKLKTVLITDTAGIYYSKKKYGLEKRIEKNTFLSVQSSDIVIFIVSAAEGITNDDYFISHFLRTRQKKVLFLVNKIDTVKEKLEINEFYRLGYKKVYKVSSLSKNNVRVNFINYLLLEIKKIIDDRSCGSESKDNYCLNNFLKPKDSTTSKLSLNGSIPIKVAVIGKPNVGKSTLVNSIVGSNRVMTSSKSGTTRDSISIPVKYNNKNYVFIDTAGIKKKKIV